MEQFSQIFSDTAYIQLSALLAGALFFFMVGLRELKDGQFQGFLFAAVGLFFLTIHLIFLFTLPDGTSPLQNLNLWLWLTTFLAPALIVLYLLFGFYNFLMSAFNAGLVKVFFGLTLFCYLFMLGMNWPADVRGLIVLTWAVVWFNIEFRTAT